MRERWTNFPGIAINNREKDRYWIGFRELILSERAFIIPILSRQGRQRHRGRWYASQLKTTGFLFRNGYRPIGQTIHPTGTTSEEDGEADDAEEVEK